MDAVTNASAAMRRGFVDTPDGQIHYRIVGEGDYLLLLHQSPRSSNEYMDMIPALSQNYRVVAMDTLGYGDSDPQPRPYLVEDFGRTVIMLLDELGIEKTHIAGHHTGAMTAIQVAATHPERVNKLVLSGAFDLNDDARQWLLERPQWHVDENGDYLMEMFQWGMTQCGNPRIAHRRVMDLLKAGENSEWGHFAVASFQIQKYCSMVQSPTRLIWGKIDLERMDARNWRATEGRHNVERGIKGSTSVMVPDGATYFPSENPDLFARLILEYLAE